MDPISIHVVPPQIRRRSVSVNLWVKIDDTGATPKTIDSLQNLSLPAGVDAEIRM